MDAPAGAFTVNCEGTVAVVERTSTWIPTRRAESFDAWNWADAGAAARAMVVRRSGRGLWVKGFMILSESLAS